MKTIVSCILIFVILICSFVGCAVQEQSVIFAQEPTTMLKEPIAQAHDPVNMLEYEHLFEYSITELKDIIDQLWKRYYAINYIINTALELGWLEEHDLIIKTRNELLQVNNKISLYQEVYEEKYEMLEMAKWEARFIQYPVATEIWLYMKDLGWSDVVCAGIMGNIMAEVGGGTLNIQYWLYDPSGEYYGICQWYYEYCPVVQGEDLKTQLDYLKSTIKYNIDLFGHIYSVDFNYEQFLSLRNEKEVALAFAKTYERCNSKHYHIRTVYATMALEYFTK